MANHKHDKLDLDILRELRENCKQNLKQLAGKLGTHPNTLMQRMRKLERETIIKKYMASIDYSKLGYDLQAVVMIKMSKGMLHDPRIITEIGQISGIEALYGVTGGHDCIAIIRAKSKDDLVNLLQKIQTNKIVTRTVTYLVLSVYKHPFEFNPLKE